jgi:hypothetical protein
MGKQGMGKQGNEEVGREEADTAAYENAHEQGC